MAMVVGSIPSSALVTGLAQAHVPPIARRRGVYGLCMDLADRLPGALGGLPGWGALSSSNPETAL